MFAAPFTKRAIHVTVSSIIGYLMTPAEWGDILDLIYDLWPSRKEWPVKAADRCYRELKGQKMSTVNAAVIRLVGARPPSPASLLVTVADIAASEARYEDRVDALPGSYDPAVSLKQAAKIRGGKSWTGWLEETNR